MFSAGAAVGYGSPQTLTDTGLKLADGVRGDAVLLRPTFMVFPPTVLDRVRQGVAANVAKAGGLAATLFAAALEAGQTIRVCYDTGYTHRLCLEPPQPPPAGDTLKHLLGELARRPADVCAEPTVPAAERLLQGIAQRHGKWRVWTDETLYLQWLLR